MWNSRACNIAYNPSLAYICGVYFGDGSIQDTGAKSLFSLTTIDLDFAEYVRNCFEPFVGELLGGISQYQDARKGRSRTYIMRVHATDFCDLVKRICDSKQQIPEFVFDHHSFKKSFVEGFFDSEGWVAKSKAMINNPRSKYHGNYVYRAGVGCTNPLMIKIGEMMQEMGLQINNLYTEILPSGKTFYRYCLNMDSVVRSGLVSHIARKQRRIDEYRAAYVSPETTK